MEQDPQIEIDIESVRELREALETCETIMNAAKLAEMAATLNQFAQRAVSDAVLKTFLSQKEYYLRVEVPEGVEAYTVKDDEIIDDSSKGALVGFNATELRGIYTFPAGGTGIEFYNREKNTSLKIKGFNFEVQPVFINELDDR